MNDSRDVKRLLGSAGLPIPAALLEVATETRTTAAPLPNDPDLATASTDERLVVMATGAALDKIRAARDLPPPAPIVELTGDQDVDRMLMDCISTMATKGAEYTVGSKDRLANFRGVAADVDVPMEKVWYTFFNKHMRAIQSYIKNGCTVKSNEPISGRIMDCIVYLLLFDKMSKEIEAGRITPTAEKD